jgi:Ca2+-binding RTX toxin-like protein
VCSFCSGIGLRISNSPSAEWIGTVREIFSDAGDGVFPLAAGEGGGSISVNAAKPVATIAQLADYLVSGFWAYNNALPHKWASNTITYNITGLNADEQFLARSALAAWRDVANLTFIETTGTANITFTHNGSMQAVTNASWYGSGAMASATVNISTNWVTSDGGANDGKTGIDSYAYQTYIHEIGHALGLGHQGPYNGSAAYSANALYANDTWQNSIMSYFSQPNYSGSSYRYVVTPQMADIYAVGVMYGTATTTRTGDTVYGFNSNAGAVFSFGNYTSAPALTIYDNGGSDTLDCSLYSSAQRIDLHGGAFSSVGGLVNNIGIALNTVIEKAIGGSGNDLLIASDLGCTLMGGAGVDTLTGGAGIDRLFGGSGVDTMTGAGGADNFVFALGDSSAASGQHDRIVDFVSGSDRIDLSAIDAIAGTAAIDLFRFLGSAAFDGTAGALNYFYNSALGVTTLQGDTNGDRVADFAIDLTGNIALARGDLIGLALSNRAPVVTAAPPANVAANAGQVLQLSSLFGATDPDGDALTYYVYDNTVASSGGRFMLNGSPLPADTMNALTAAQFAQLTFVAGPGGTSDDLYVKVSDGQAYTAWSEFHVNVAGGNRAPVVTAPPASVSATSGQVLQVSTLCSATDPDGDALTYYVYDNTVTAGGGHFVLNGSPLSADTMHALTAAQFAQLTFVAGASGSTDNLNIKVYDGHVITSWNTFNINVSAAANQAPVVIPPPANVSASVGQVLQLSNLFGATDPDGDALTYYVYDNTVASSGGHFALNGSPLPADKMHALTAAQFAQATFVAGPNGTSDDLYIKVYDGHVYTAWNEFHVNV